LVFLREEVFVVLWKGVFWRFWERRECLEREKRGCGIE